MNCEFAVIIFTWARAVPDRGRVQFCRDHCQNQQCHNNEGYSYQKIGCFLMLFLPELISQFKLRISHGRKFWRLKILWPYSFYGEMAKNSLIRALESSWRVPLSTARGGGGESRWFCVNFEFRGFCCRLFIFLDFVVLRAPAEHRPGQQHHIQHRAEELRRSGRRPTNTLCENAR